MPLNDLIFSRMNYRFKLYRELGVNVTAVPAEMIHYWMIWI